MKKTIFSTLLMAIVMTVIFACGGGAPKVETSPEMKEFVGMIKGKSADVTAALTKFGAEGLDTKDMGMYDLKEPVVTAKEGDCYTFEAKAGVTTRTYKVCWATGKINKVEDLGMK